MEEYVHASVFEGSSITLLSNNERISFEGTVCINPRHIKIIINENNYVQELNFSDFTVIATTKDP